MNSTERNFTHAKLTKQIESIEVAGIEAYVLRPQRGFAVREELFRKEEFQVLVQT